MSDNRGHWALSGARAVVGAAIAVASVLAVAAAIAAPWPVIERDPVSVVAAPTPSDTLAVCDGGLLAAGRDADKAGDISVGAPAEPIVASGGEVRDIRLESPDVTDSDGAAAFSSPPQGAAATPLAAAASVQVSASDLSGFAADACRPPLFESWLVGGSTSTGDTDLVLLANPGDVTATAEITVYGGGKAVVPPGGSAVTIPARTQRVIPLAGLALGEDSPVLRITATGAPVRASLQSSVVRTLVPGGVDQQSAVAAPAQLQVIPGVVVTAPPGQAGASDTPTILRVLSPTGSGQAVVTVRAIGASSPARPAATIPLSAQIPTELDLGGLAKGAYVVTVESDRPVVAAVWQTTGFGTGSDYAWLTSAPALEGPTLVAVPSGPSPTLQLANTGTVEATVTLRAVRGGGADRTITVPAQGSAAIALTPRSVWELDPGAGQGAALHAQVTLTGVGALAGYAVWPSDAAVAPVRVYP